MHNVHERAVDAPANAVGALLDRLATHDDPIWPAPAWPPLVLDRPLGVGADGGHGPIRYRVTDYEPGRRVRFTFHPVVGIAGHHELSVTPAGDDRCLVRHIVTGRLSARTHLTWPVAVRWLHDALIEDLLDNVERAATGRVNRPARRSWWVRWLRARLTPRPRPARVPDSGQPGPAALDRVDFADAWQVRLPRGVSTNPVTWAEAMFREPPGWVAALFELRNALVRLVGIEPAGTDVFAVRHATDDQAWVGADAGHLDFRVGVRVDGRTATVISLARLNNRRGRLYFAVVRPLHPMVVRTMLHRASRRLTDRAPTAPERAAAT